MIYKKKIDNFFLLDISFPFINKLVYKNEKNIAIRVSEYEPIELAYRMKSKINWIWLDCFNGFPLSQSQVKEINQIGLKICLVSPELHGLPRTKYEITHFKRKIKDYKLKVSAVCTKFPTLW
ncbi:hypothetical protein N9Z35_07355 [Alphaproteobacteria bacterium]|nr:hypothetical protein [Alphaproteobacteria bacterium]